MYGAGDVRVENVPDAHMVEPTDALVRVTRAGIWRVFRVTKVGDRRANLCVGA